MFKHKYPERSVLALVALTICGLSVACSSDDPYYGYSSSGYTYTPPKPVIRCVEVPLSSTSFLCVCDPDRVATPTDRYVASCDPPQKFGKPVQCCSYATHPKDSCVCTNFDTTCVAPNYLPLGADATCTATTTTGPVASSSSSSSSSSSGASGSSGSSQPKPECQLASDCGSCHQCTFGKCSSCGYRIDKPGVCRC
jgi:hypothetical protein